MSSLHLSSTDFVVRNKRSSFAEAEEETIEIKPSSELIPDEYEHLANGKIVVHLFTTMWTPNVTNVNVFSETLRNIGYQIEENVNIHNLEEGEVCSEVLEGISKEVNEGKDGLILFFSGVADSESSSLLFNMGSNPIKISDVWKKFTSKNCPGLKNKPKIFIFQASEHATIQRDFADDIKHYDTPAEADMLIIYNKTDVSSHHDASDFSKQVCDNINLYGSSEDIVSLVTCTEDNGNSRPLIISTLTRKFYLTASEHRGDHHHIAASHEELAQILSTLQETLSAAKDPTPKKKKLLGLGGFSFRFPSGRQAAEADSGKPKPKAAVHPARDRKTSATSNTSDRPPWRKY